MNKRILDYRRRLRFMSTKELTAEEAKRMMDAALLYLEGKCRD